MRTLGAVGFGVAVAVAVALVAFAAELAFIGGAVATGAASWLLERHSPRTRPQRVARSVGIGIAVIAMLWLVAIVVALSAIPEDFSESF